MPWIHVPDWAAAEGLPGELYERFKLPDGSMDNILGIHRLHPEGLQAHYGLYREAMFARGPLSRAERELAAVVVSAINRCRY